MDQKTRDEITHVGGTHDIGPHVDETQDTRTLDERLVRVVPSARQLSFQQLEFYAFIHFTVNTFTGREWGDGTESPSIFHPAMLDARQWVDSIRSAGMKGLILTCKHHDGFCLWPSRHTAHTVAASPFRNGKGDVVREVSEACREAGIRFGVYLSPWDRNCAVYGQGKPYDDYFVAQLTELLTGYGDIFTVWFDGACGEGLDGRRQVYDWDRYHAVIRELQPNACITVCGPDIRWCGNEAGDTRPSEWSVVPARTRDTERIAEASQQQDDEAFRQRTITARDQDLGSRDALRDEPDLVWYPAEVNTSIRPGWFHHAEEDDQVRTLEAMLHIYRNSVGGNATFLLNIPPTKDGLIHENDQARLAEIGAYLRNAFAVNLVDEAVLTVECTKTDEVKPSGVSFDGEKTDGKRSDGMSVTGVKAGHDVECVRRDDDSTWFMTEDGVTSATIELAWESTRRICHVILKENIRLSQRIESFALDAHTDGAWKTVHEGTVVGYKRIVKLDGSATPRKTTPENPTTDTGTTGMSNEGITADRLRIRITDARVAPTLMFAGVF